MAALDTTRFAQGSFGLVGRFAALGTTIANAFAAWNDARATRNALTALSDRELEDIGLSRADIDTVAAGKTVY
ncbi:DUF1127 domain-containing protein [Ruegeria pomeroyi]|uniref:DUF1127 domain-containing protein n=1 Tax=Ruegeria alba TaxID=2916756 RepID=A0ABS9NX84_9RHOB|nr:DUF1127 domain-containing protein [Ruegeria alba]MCE8513386.1 DUF1127 domain-containing protein [Ruegeria pomeroyi]MCE8520263.1 DUF1127 domain-containing protein [Ruegeria pomeroyi]MCE8525189.1 DUF1127 domain-containing protein [Ruegeria pomeroyi]MCE8530146.1 DUF1127 domain-containing protein [Ruegeria pomeroyi]MCE8534928.1 DUF1127 domain-containing protein [Ruegeria pomeroyi]